MPDQTVKSGEMEDYSFGDAAPPTGYDADSGGYENPPPGWHIFELTEFEIKEHNLWKGKDFGEWTGNQIRPHLTVADGPHKSKTIMDFLPIPTQGRDMPKSLANRWANFIRACGFQAPADRLVPIGFKLHQLIGAKCRAEIVKDTYEDKDRIKVKFFGYNPIKDDAPSGVVKPEKPEDVGLNLDEL